MTEIQTGDSTIDVPTYPFPGTLTREELKACTEGFYEWFCELEGFHIREERFWDAVEHRKDRELLEWLKTAYKMGYEHRHNQTR